MLVIGCGPVGLLSIACAKALGADRVIAADLFENKLKLAVEMGADETINCKNDSLAESIMKMTSGRGIERICEASGHSKTLGDCFSWLRKGGKIGIVGIPKDPVEIKNPLPGRSITGCIDSNFRSYLDLVFKSLEVHTVHGRRIFHSWEECEKLIHSGLVKPGQYSLALINCDS